MDLKWGYLVGGKNTLKTRHLNYSSLGFPFPGQTNNGRLMRFHRGGQVGVFKFKSSHNHTKDFQVKSSHNNTKNSSLLIMNKISSQVKSNQKAKIILQVRSSRNFIIDHFKQTWPQLPYCHYPCDTILKWFCNFGFIKV